MNRSSRRVAAAGLGIAVVVAGTLAATGSGSAGAKAAPAIPAWGTSTSASAGVQGVLNGVAAAASNDAVAVGAHTVNPPEAAYLRDAYAEHWDGTTWTSTNVPVPVFGQNQTSVLAAAAAAGPANSWAVGSVNSSAGTTTLAFHWNGSTWTRSVTPNPGGTSGSDHLYDVTARGPSDVWAVGDYGPYPSRSLLEHWDGSRWSQVTVPNIGVLRSVTTDANSVWVASQSTVLHKTSTGWTKLPPPADANGTATPDIRAVVRSGGNLWAVGARSLSSGGEPSINNAFAAYWNGSRWAVVSPEDKNPLTDAVAAAGGIEAPSSNEVLAITPSSVTGEPTPIRPAVGLDSIAVDSGGHRFAVGEMTVGSGPYSHLAPGIIASPAAGQGGIITTGGSLVTWLGPVSGSVPADKTGTTPVGGLPAGAYTVIMAAPYCTPAVHRVTVQTGQSTTVPVATIAC